MIGRLIVLLIVYSPGERMSSGSSCELVRSIASSSEVTQVPSGVLTGVRAGHSTAAPLPQEFWSIARMAMITTQENTWDRKLTSSMFDNTYIR